MKDSPQKNQSLNKKVIETIDKVLATGDWEATLYLRTAAKNLRKLRDQAVTLLAASETETTTAPVKPVLNPGYVAVFISLYQTDGNNLHKWQTILRSLSEFSVTRPVYAKEEYIQELIRAKQDPIREAYVCAHVKESDIIKTGKQQYDRFEHELLNLKEGAVQLDSVIEFIHANKHYKLQEGLLLPINP